MRHSQLRPGRCLQTNPLIVAWPGDDLNWFLLDEEGGVKSRVPLSDGAASVLRAFTRPRSVDAIFGESASHAEEILAECLEQGLMLPVESDTGEAIPPPQSEIWAGFRFSDRANATSLVDPSPVVTRRHEIAGKMIGVLDHVLERSWIVAVHRWFFQLAFRRIDVDTWNTVHSRHWINAFSPAERFEKAVPVFQRLVAHIRAAAPEREATLRRINAYSTTYGDLPLLHRDLESGEGLTGVFYGNAEWDSGWTGETVFCDDDGEAMIVVPPRPGRLVVFDGSLLHRAGAPSRECHENRYTLVFKFSVP